MPLAFLDFFNDKLIKSPYSTHSALRLDPLDSSHWTRVALDWTVHLNSDSESDSDSDNKMTWHGMKHPMTCSNTVFILKTEKYRMCPYLFVIRGIHLASLGAENAAFWTLFLRCILNFHFRFQKKGNRADHAVIISPRGATWNILTAILTRYQYINNLCIKRSVSGLKRHHFNR